MLVSYLSIYTTSVQAKPFGSRKFAKRLALNLMNKPAELLYRSSDSAGRKLIGLPFQLRIVSYYAQCLININCHINVTLAERNQWTTPRWQMSTFLMTREIITDNGTNGTGEMLMLTRYV